MLSVFIVEGMVLVRMLSLVFILMCSVWNMCLVGWLVCWVVVGVVVMRILISLLEWVIGCFCCVLMMKCV